MAVGIRVGGIIDEIGTSAFLHAFFSTITAKLESSEWGSRYPELMNDLYQGELDERLANKALRDLKEIQSNLKRFKPDEVVWDIEDPNAKPPWGEKISEDCTDLSNYFVTSTGRDLISVLIECLEALRDEGGILKIEEI